MPIIFHFSQIQGDNMITINFHDTTTTNYLVATTINVIIIIPHIQCVIRMNNKIISSHDPEKPPFSLTVIFT